MILVRFLGLVVLLNLIRYFVIGFIEGPLILPRLFGAMENSPEYFNTSFTTLDWVTSFFYNFTLWLSCIWIFHLTRPTLKGSDLAASLKAFGVGWLFFASLSGVYMNHYSHPKDFYFWNVLDALLVFALVAVANGLLYRLMMGPYASPGPTIRGPNERDTPP